MDIGLIVTFAGIVVAGLAGVLGVWMERDPEGPARWAWVFSALIAVAMVIEGGHAVAAASEDGETEEAMARVLEKLSDMASSGDNPALASFVGAELAAQARSNPKVMKRLEKKVAAKGGDPTALRRQASESRRTSAGLPARAPSKPGAKAGGAGAKARSEGARPDAGKAKAGPGDASKARTEDPTKAKAGGAGEKAKAGAGDAAKEGTEKAKAEGAGKAKAATDAAKQAVPVPVPTPKGGKSEKAGKNP